MAGACASPPALAAPTAAGTPGRLEGDPGALDLSEDGELDSPAYPNGLERLWSLLACVNAGEVVASATPGFEFLDAGGKTHLGGGSHGSLHAADSLVPLAFCGLDEALAGQPEQRSIADLAPVVRAHFGIPQGS